eukprot:353710-Chlamydomonas_euryale.AAC.3
MATLAHPGFACAASAAACVASACANSTTYAKGCGAAGPCSRACLCRKSPPLPPLPPRPVFRSFFFCGTTCHVASQGVQRRPQAQAWPYRLACLGVRCIALLVRGQANSVEGTGQARASLHLQRAGGTPASTCSVQATPIRHGGSANT